MSDVLRVQWTIIPGSAPEPGLNCNRCRGTTRFRTSGKIRVNANGKRVDAWLIYKCTSCDKHLESAAVLERRHVSTIDPHLLASLQTNDPDLSRRLAFEKLRRKLKVEHDDATVRKEVLSESALRSSLYSCNDGMLIPETGNCRVSLA